jgi:hypothetical protein
VFLHYASFNAKSNVDNLIGECKKASQILDSFINPRFTEINGAILRKILRRAKVSHSDLLGPLGLAQRSEIHISSQNCCRKTNSIFLLGVTDLLDGGQNFVYIDDQPVQYYYVFIDAIILRAVLAPHLDKTQLVAADLTAL